MIAPYDYSDARARCYEAGLIFDDRMVPLFESVAIPQKLTQEHVDQLLGAHIEATIWQWNRRNYPWFVRIAMAFYWLGFGRSIGHGYRNN